MPSLLETCPPELLELVCANLEDSRDHAAFSLVCSALRPSGRQALYSVLSVQRGECDAFQAFFSSNWGLLLGVRALTLSWSSRFAPALHWFSGLCTLSVARAKGDLLVSLPLLQNLRILILNFTAHREVGCNQLEALLSSCPQLQELALSNLHLSPRAMWTPSQLPPSRLRRLAITQSSGCSIFGQPTSPFDLSTITDFIVGDTDWTPGPEAISLSTLVLGDVLDVLPGLTHYPAMSNLYMTLDAVERLQTPQEYQTLPNTVTELHVDITLRTSQQVSNALKPFLDSTQRRLVLHHPSNQLPPGFTLASNILVSASKDFTMFCAAW
uniref:F-box domain-containing protein n=1 Tax=Mycena chlorophos TaxID=658473 RepID=A0ABQ0LAN7_MYCCL|nr:predicted protein [Mycena chlorophos]